MVRSAWGEDALARGAFAYPKVGNTEDAWRRTRMVVGLNVWLAGEHTSPEHFASAAGAFIAGQGRVTVAYDSGQLGASSRLLACSRSLRQHSSVCCPFPADRHFCAAWLTRRGGVGVQLRGARQSVPGPMGDELLCWPLRSRSRSPLPASPVPERLKFSPISSNRQPQPHLSLLRLQNNKTRQRPSLSSAGSPTSHQALRAWAPSPPNLTSSCSLAARAPPSCSARAEACAPGPALASHRESPATPRTARPPPRRFPHPSRAPVHPASPRPRPRPLRLRRRSPAAPQSPAHPSASPPPLHRPRRTLSPPPPPSTALPGR
eukprot:3449159-Rhodomonas_salina.1